MAETEEDHRQAPSSSSTLAVAALSVCESLLLALQEQGVLDDHEVDGLLEDVETAHRSAGSDGSADGALHDAVADLVEEIRRGGNSVRLIKKLR